MFILQNELCRFTIGLHGALVSLHQTEHHLTLKQDELRIKTDWGELSCFQEQKPKVEIITDDLLKLNFETAAYTLGVCYCLKKDRAYLQRTITLKCHEAVSLYQICSRHQMEKIPLQVLDYQTFWNCPTVGFVCYDEGGMYTGFEHPYFSVVGDGEYVETSFEPSLLLKAGESYKSEPQFFGLYQNTGRKLQQQTPPTAMRYNDVDHTRYRNPCGHIALDVGQINAFSEYARDYVQLRVKEFKLIFYQFFITLPQQPKTDEEEQTYYHYIDNFARMGGDIITFNPLVRHLPPRPTQDGFWELAPAGSRAERILNYARGKGFDIGFYMGSAAGNAAYCTSPMVPFAGDDRAIWKKRDRSGACSSENCIACDEFAEWFYQVQHNTIHKYDVTLWSWDPGPGNGLFCYSTQHGHIPGKGAYKGFQNAMKVVSKLKNDFPRLYIQGFHGTKEYGLWGLRGFDQHECYWEQSPYDMATTYLDLSEDRLTASGMRFQSMWNQNFRFLPPEMNHALASRMTQYCLMPEELRFLYDQLGWKYAFFSSLAVGASMTVTMIPECLDEISRGEYEQYYRKWIPWARKYFDYAKHTIPFGAQVVCGAMDGFARIKGNHGFLFMFNPGPLEVDACFTLDETIGLKVEGIYHLTELYPMQQVLRCDESNGKSSFALHDCMHTHLAPYSATLWELRQEKPMEISWCNLPGSLRLEGDAAIIDGCYGEDGTEKCGVLTAGETVKKIVINGVDMPFERKFQCAMVNVAFGIQSLPRSICHWRDTEGKYELSEQAEKFKFSIHTTFSAPCTIKTYMNAHTPKNVKERDAIIEKMKQELGRNHFAWAQPDHLFLLLPFEQPTRLKELNVRLNGQSVTVECVDAWHDQQCTRILHYADISELVMWDCENTLCLEAEGIKAESFLGARLYYPNGDSTDVVMIRKPAEGIIAHGPIGLPRQLKPLRKGEIAPVVENAWIAEGIIRENHPYELCACVNLPVDALEGVYASAQISIDAFSGNTLRADQRLIYDAQSGLWKRFLVPGARKMLIIDGKDIFVWAVTKNGVVSQTKKVPVLWQLCGV